MTRAGFFDVGFMLISVLTSAGRSPGLVAKSLLFDASA